MDLQTLQVFVEVVRRGSFAAVARDHDVDPSSISRTIANLENELDLRLFHRSTRRLTATEAGLIYFDRVEALVEELERARLKAMDASGRAKGVLRVSSPVSFAQLNIVPLLPELAELHPELIFELILTDAKLDLLEERIDVAIRIGDTPEKGLAFKKISPMVARVCASPAYLEKHGRPKTPSDLEQHNCMVLNQPGFGDRWHFTDPSGARSEIQVQGQLRTSNAMTLKQCALADMGVILQARWIVGRELRQGDLIDLFPDYQVTASEFEQPAAWVVHPSRNYLPFKLRAFVGFLLKKFETTPPWDTL
jgi:DNA-binding transcriptional LysR family regulator